MPFAALDLFGGVVANISTVRIGSHALAVQDGGCGEGTFVLSSADSGAEGVIETGLTCGSGSTGEECGRRFPRRKVAG